MKREQMTVDFRSLAKINDNWQSLLAKMPPFMQDCELLCDWGGIVLANTAFRNVKLSIDTLRYRDDEFDDFPEFAERMNGREVLIFSISLNDKHPTEKGADLLIVYFAMTEDLTKLDSMIVFSDKHGAFCFPETQKELQEMLDYFMVIMPWRERLLAESQS